MVERTLVTPLVGKSFLRFYSKLLFAKFCFAKIAKNIAIRKKIQFILLSKFQNIIKIIKISNKDIEIKRY